MSGSSSEDKSKPVALLTVFSLETCPHCRRVKALFDAKGWRYTDLSLSDYPELRRNMLKAADRLTVPQVFLNDTPLGGASEVMLLANSGKLASMLSAASPRGPTSALLRRPSHPPKKEAPLAPRTEPEICIGGACAVYADCVALLLEFLPIQDRKYRLRRYHNVFLGADLVDLLVAHFKLPGGRPEGLEAGRMLQAVGVFDHVSGEHALQDNRDLFYRLQAHSSPLVLNRWRKWADRVDQNPVATVKACRVRLMDIVERHTSVETGLVAYGGVAVDPAFVAFEEAVCELQAVKLEAMDRHFKMAFCINLYNMAIVHAFAKVGYPDSNFGRLSFFDNVCYDIGGHVLSFSAIENGVLRANATPPFHLRKPLPAAVAKAVALDAVDPRIHFALNCGASSCPPVKTYTTEAIEEELRIVALAFCEDDGNVRVDADSRTLWLSKIFSWYRVDFCPTRAELPDRILTWLRGDKAEALRSLLRPKVRPKLRIRFLEYSWATNAASGGPIYRGSKVAQDTISLWP